MLKFFYSNGSSALAAHILLEEVGAAYEAIEVSISGGEHRKPQFLERNPKGRIPVLETPDGPIFETGAILLWLADRHGLMAPAPQDTDRADFLKWLLWDSR